MFSFLLLLENLLYLTPTLLALINLISIIKDLFGASVYTGLNCPTPTLLIFLGLLNFVPFRSEVPRFCVSAETKLFLKSKLPLWEGLSNRLGWYAEGCKWQGTPWTSILQIAVDFQEALTADPAEGRTHLCPLKTHQARGSGTSIEGGLRCKMQKKKVSR